MLSKGGNKKQSELANTLILEKSTVNRNLKLLLSSGYISKKDFPYFSISEKGLKHLEQIIPAWDMAMKEIKEKLKPEGEQALSILTNQLIQ